MSNPPAGTTAGCGSPHWGAGEIIAVDLDGVSEVVGDGPPGLGWSMEWLPDGPVRQVADAIAFPNGMIVTPDNSTLIVAESFAGRLTAFDIAADGNLSNRRVWAEGIGPDGNCLDAEGAVWTQMFTGSACVRVRQGGQVLETIALDRSPFACMLGGPDGRTLFILAAEWRGIEKVDEALAARTGQVLTVRAPAPRAGWP